MAVIKHETGPPERALPRSCEQCCWEIPYNPESADYVLFFCGADCYRKWSEQNPQAPSENVFVPDTDDGSESPGSTC